MTTNTRNPTPSPIRMSRGNSPHSNMDFLISKKNGLASAPRMLVVIIRNLLLSENRAESLDIVRKSKGEFPIKKWTWAVIYPRPRSLWGRKFLIKISI